MANVEHLRIVERGSAAIADWREANKEPLLDLRGANLEGADLRKIDLSGANLSGSCLRDADLSGSRLQNACIQSADLFRVNLAAADLRGAELMNSNLSGANLRDANLNGANMFCTTLIGANATAANLTETDLTGASLVHCNLRGARILGARVYGCSAWDLVGEPSEQIDLIITPYGAHHITVDNLKIAQFLYLLVNNPEIRAAIDTITSKVVLILGRFTKERKEVLDALRGNLRKFGYVPVLFDFEKPRSRDTVETIRTLASLSRFIVADLTDAKSVLQELQAIVPDLPSLPIQPIIQKPQLEPGMLDHIYAVGRGRVLELVEYESVEGLLRRLGDIQQKAKDRAMALRQ